MRGADAPFLVPFDRNADRLALIVDAFDREHGDGGEVARPVDVLAPCRRSGRRRPSPAAGASGRSACRPMMPKARAISRLPALPGLLGDEMRGSLRGSEARSAASASACAASGPIPPPPWPCALARRFGFAARGLAARARRAFAAGPRALPAFARQKLDRLLQRHVLRLHRARQRGVDLAVVHVGAVAAGAHRHRPAERRMLAELLQDGRRCRARPRRSSSRPAARWRGWRRP